jgi:hypothetical protein
VSWRDEFELLCERCGYSIEGLAREGGCPECGHPVAASLPEARVGSAWQRGPGFRSWCATVGRCVTRPRAAAKVYRIEDERSARFRRVNILLASAVLTVAPALTYGVQMLRRAAPYSMRDLTWPWAETTLRWLGLAALLLGWWALLAFALSVMTGVETWGIRTFGRVHGKRITRTVARTITAHATAGWGRGGGVHLGRVPAGDDALRGDEPPQCRAVPRRDDAVAARQRPDHDRGLHARDRSKCVARSTSSPRRARTSSASPCPRRRTPRPSRRSCRR